VRRDDLGVSYLEHFFLPREEFAFTSLNLRRGLAPPISGAYGTWYGSSTGALMRCELWALLLPGAPQQAAACAYRDASIDHRDEGIWAAMFFAGLASAAFFITDVRSLLTIGLAMIPRTCRTARAVKAALVAAYNAEPHGAARDRILKEAGSPNYTDAPQMLASWLSLYYMGDATLVPVFAPQLTVATMPPALRE
jgi:ADP-ribosylglycohydrolase